MKPAQKRILLVEDEPVTARVHERELRELGYAVTLAACASEAIEKARSDDEPIDLILMDIDLGPGMDGADAARTILAEREIPLVFLSGHTDPEIVARTEAISSYGYAVKNTGMTVINASIRMAFRLFEARRAIDAINKRLTESEERFSLAMQASLDGIFDWNPTTGSVYYSPGWIRMLGWDDAEVQPSFDEWERLTEPADAQRVKQIIAETVNSRAERFEAEFRMRHKDGRWIDILGRARMIYDEAGNLCRVVGTHTDITERKRAAETIEREERFTRALLDSIPGMVYLYDEEGRLLRWNRQHEILTGYSAEELATMRLLDWYQGDQPTIDRINRAIERMMTHGYASEEAEVRIKDGSRVPFRFTAVLLEIEGKRYFTGIGIDISEQREKERIIAESEAKFRSLVENANDILYSLTHDGIFTYVSPKWTDLLGHPAAAVTGTSFEQYVHPEDIPVCRGFLEMVFSSRSRQSGVEYRVRHANGHWCWHTTNAAPQFADDGSVSAFIGIARDITEHKLIEAALIESERKYRMLAENSTDVIWLLDITDGRFQYVSPSVERLRGFTPEEVLAQPMSEALVPESLDYVTNVVRERVERFMNGERTTFVDEIAQPCKDGTVVWTESTTRYSHSDESGHIMVFGASRDITERKRAEDEVKRLLEEKKLLLKEVHHRVKNNMSIIKSLLSLQMRYISEPKAVTALKDAIGRIETMGILYDRLYRSDSFQEVSLRDYLVPLVEKIAGVFPHAADVRLDLDITEAALTADIISSLGIIINELVSNAFKHAYTPGKPGVLSLQVSRSDSDVRIRIADTGPGFANSNEAPRGFGLTLVEMLVAQLNGTLTRTNQDGCVFEILFPL